MATQVQLRRGTSAENDAFTGAQGEVTVDTTNDTLRVHDGSQAGGYEIAKSDSQTHTNVDIDSGTIDGVTLGTNSPVTSAVLTTADINGGNIDGTTIGESTPSAITGTTVTATGLVTAQDGLVVDNDGATVATFDRATSDGTIAEFQKDGSSVGSIGSLGGYAHYTSGNGGIRPIDNSQLRPVNADGTASDNTMDLGTSGIRFKDLYLSGGVYLGGTGAANYLDDYEEGTWTPVDSSAGGLTFTVASAVYTKIGSWVNFNFSITFPSTGSSADVKIGGLPFSIAQDSAGTMGYTNATVETEGVQIQDNFVYLIAVGGGYRENQDYSGKIVRIMGGYQTTS